MKKALVVGINAYPDGARLYGSVNDAIAITALLQTNEDGSKNFDDVHLVKDVLSKSRLRTHIVDLFKGDCETALLYFSGHGYINELGGYIVTPDRKEYDEGILMDEILKLANASKARNKIVILDCCHSGAMGAPSLLGAGASYLGEGVTILTASKHDEPACEVKGQGIFTNLLIEALKGGAADISGHITAGSTYAFIDRALGAFDQRPVFKTNTTRFSALRKVTPHVPVAVLQRITDYFPAPDAAYPLDPSYEDTNVAATVVSYTKAPYADEHKVAIFKHLQLLQSQGLLVPVDAPFMFFAAMESKSCKLTPLGQYYWRLAEAKRI